MLPAANGDAASFERRCYQRRVAMLPAVDGRRRAEMLLAGVSMLPAELPACVVFMPRVGRRGVMAM